MVKPFLQFFRPPVFEDEDATLRAQMCDSMFARGDREMLQVVVDELLDNAWKFTAVREAPFVEFGGEQTQDGSQIFLCATTGSGLI